MFATISPRRLMFLAAAMLLSLVTALTVRGWVEHVRTQSQPAAQKTEAATPKMVLVAAKPLPAGHFIKTEDLTWQSWPDANIASSYMVKGVVKSDTLVGSVVRTGIGAGEPITDTRIVKKGEHGFLAAILTPGMRAITVQMQSNTGLSGLVIPGDRVDLILTMSVPGSSKEAPERKVSETVLQDIRVLAVDQRMDDQSNDAPMARTTTIEVTPKQAEIVTLLTEMGKLSMTLRSVGSAENDAQPHHPTMTWDSDATDLPIFRHRPSLGRSYSERVEVTRGMTNSSVDFSSGVAVESGRVSAEPASGVGAAAAKAISKAGGAK
jgi:pilus assembly protein CpaB